MPMQRPDPVAQRQFAVEVVARLRAAGFQAYWAGGCVRDQILGRLPNDFDVVTAARPEAIRALFGQRRTLAIGAAFGVITVLGPRGAGQIEVATFRRDVDYQDGRRPSSVEFSSPEEDAQRRDFTINGLFFDPVAEQVIDFVDGQADLQRRIVRAIREPAERFTEDKLRLLRAIRFAAVLEFELEDGTRRAIERMAGQVTAVSAERIAAEMELMLVDGNRARAVSLLRDVGLLAAILPEVAALADAGPRSLPEDAGIWSRTLALLEALDEPTFALALAVLLNGVADPAIATVVGRRWRLARSDFERTGWLLMQRGDLLRARALRWSQLQPLLIHPGSSELLKLGDALVAIGQCDLAELAFCRERLALAPEELDPPPLVTGEDLIARNIPRGKIYARLLRQVREAQLDGQVGDKDQALALVDALREST